MNIHDKLDKLKNQITTLEAVSTEILNACVGETKHRREQILNIIKSYEIFDLEWRALGRFHSTIEAIYKEYDPTFDFPQFKVDSMGLDWIYTTEHGYLLLKIDTVSEYNAVMIVGLPSLFNSYKENTTERTPESIYYFVMNCIQYLQKVARKMLTLPIFNSNEFILSSLMYHYYLDYKIDRRTDLRHVMSAMGGFIRDDFRRMVFETDGSDPLSVRGSLPILSHYARKKTCGHYLEGYSNPSEFVRNMRSNKALNLRKAFAKMERSLSYDHASSHVIVGEEEITFQCTVGVSTQEPHYNRRKRFSGISAYPAVFFDDSLLGLFSTCMDPRSSNYDEQYIGWVDYSSIVNVYKRYESMFNYLEDNVIDTLEDNYNFLLEKLPSLNKDRLRNDMLNYITEGR